MPRSPLTVRAAAAVQAAEAIYVLVATVLSAVDTTVPGRPYRLSEAVALTVIGAASAVALLAIAFGIMRVRRWSRTPAFLTQFFAIIIGIYALQSNQLGWGVPLVVLAAAGVAALLAPTSLRALTGGNLSGHQSGPPAR